MKVKMCFIWIIGFIVFGMPVFGSESYYGFEKIDRGFTGIAGDGRRVFLSWRLLQEDVKENKVTGFNIYRSASESIDGDLLNPGGPVLNQTCFEDIPVPEGNNLYYYTLKEVIKNVSGEWIESTEKNQILVDLGSVTNNYYRIIMTGGPSGEIADNSMSATSLPITIGDLNGDGEMDFVLKRHERKYESGVISEFIAYYDAYRHNGQFMATLILADKDEDVDFNIDNGAYTHPFIIWDFDGDLTNGSEVVTTKWSVFNRCYQMVMYRVSNGQFTQIAEMDLPSPYENGVFKGQRFRNAMCVAYLNPSNPQQPCLVYQQGVYPNDHARIQYYAYTGTGFTELLSSPVDLAIEGIWMGGGHWIKVGDYNGDGIDEVLIGNHCFNYLGQRIWDGWAEGTQYEYVPKHGDYQCLRDVDTDGFLEVVTSYEDAYLPNNKVQVDDIDNTDENSMMLNFISSDNIDVKCVYSGNFDPSDPSDEIYMRYQMLNYSTPKYKRGIFKLNTVSGQFDLIYQGEDNWENDDSGSLIEWDGLRSGLYRTGSMYLYQNGVISGESLYRQIGSSPLVADISGDYRDEIISINYNPLAIRVDMNTSIIQSRAVTALQDRMYRQCRIRSGRRENGVISGQITGDWNGLGLPGVVVQLTSVSESIERECRTDNQGQFSFQFLPAGDYMVSPKLYNPPFLPDYSTVQITLASDNDEEACAFHVQRSPEQSEHKYYDFSDAFQLDDFFAAGGSGTRIQDAENWFYRISPPASGSSVVLIDRGYSGTDPVTAYYYDNFEITFKAKSDEWSTDAWADYCLYFNYNDNDGVVSFYKLMFNKQAGESKLFFTDNGVQTVCRVLSGLQLLDGFRDIEVELQNGALTVMYNGITYLEQYTLTNVLGGQIGFGSYNDVASFDDIAVTLLDPAALTVDAGPDRVISLNETLTLQASVLPAGTPVLWEKVSGPGTVSFSDADAVNSQVSFDQIGTYMLSLTADNGENTVSDNVTVEVTETLITGTAALNPRADNYLETIENDIYTRTYVNTAHGILLTGCKYDNTKKYRRRIVLDFDFSTIPSGATIEQADLKLYCTDITNDAGMQTIEVHQILAPWVDNQSCWLEASSGGTQWLGCEPNNTFAGTQVWASTDIQSTKFQWYAFDVTGLVQHFVDSPSQNYGMLLKIVNDAFTTQKKQFQFCSTSAGDPNLHPVLEIQYTWDGIEDLQVDAGQDASVMIGTPLQLNGTVTPEDASVVWEKVSGPGEAVFTDAASTGTSVTFDQIGFYVLSLNANYADQSETDEVLVEVTSAVITATMHLNPVADTYLEMDNQNDWMLDSKCWNHSILCVGNKDVSGRKYIRRTILKFDLSGLPADAVIQSAALKLCSTNITDVSVSSAANVYKVLVPWIETETCWRRSASSGLLWNGCSPNNVYASSSSSASTMLNMALGWYTWDITALAADWAAAPENNHGLLIKLPNDDFTTTKRMYVFASMLASADKYPELEVVYTTSLAKKGEEAGAEALPETYALHQNWPNPFNPVTTIGYTLPEAVHVEVAVYDMLGRQIAVLANGHKEAGAYQVLWDARNGAGSRVSSGIYFIKMTAGNQRFTRKMVLLK
ncbi:DNRLRE domain-containing protein [bacterium]|nr:DNRLRE domain-containing protein [bacterium]